MTAPPPPPPHRRRPVAAAGAIDAKKIYGMGDAAVHALDGVTVAFEPGRFTAIMGPSGSGKSTLLHCLAGLDSLTEGAVYIGETYLATLDDKDLTELRREQVGFVFQAYNLIPTLTAEENITLPLMLGGERRRRGVDRPRDRHGRPARPADAPAERAVGRPAAARRRRPRPRQPARRSSSPTSRPATSTRNSGAEILQFMRDAVDEFGQTIVMVTHDPNAAAYADRIVFLADGRIVARDVGADRRQDHRPDEADRPLRMIGKFPSWREGRCAPGRAARSRIGLAILASASRSSSGSFILADSLQATFDNLFTELTDERRPRGALGARPSTTSPPSATRCRPRSPTTSAAVHGVAIAEGGAARFGDSCSRRTATPIDTSGAPALGVSWTEDPRAQRRRR